MQMARLFPKQVCFTLSRYCWFKRVSVLMTDPFKAKEADPLKTMAIDSSLWELTSFSSHYLASVSTLAKIFTQQLSKPNYQLEDFLDHTYSLVRVTIPLNRSQPNLLAW